MVFHRLGILNNLQKLKFRCPCCRAKSVAMVTVMTSEIVLNIANYQTYEAVYSLPT